MSLYRWLREHPGVRVALSSVHREDARLAVQEAARDGWHIWVSYSEGWLEAVCELEVARRKAPVATVSEVARAPGAPALAPAQLPAEGMNLVAYLDMVERSLIQQALDRTDGNKAQAAKLLGMNRTTLVEKCKRQGAER